VVCQTRDHSRVQLLIDQGVITEAQAANHPERNKVYSCLGGHRRRKSSSRARRRWKPATSAAVHRRPVGRLSGRHAGRALKQRQPDAGRPDAAESGRIRGGPNADNLSMVAVRWEDSYVEPGPERHLDADDAARHGHHQARRIRPQPEAYKTELTEDEIERAIEEIRSTIQKYSK
jgi:serine/threonine protein phosphatase PrpC